MRVFRVQLLTAVAAFTVLLTPPTQAQTEKIIYSFSGGADGSSPVAGLILDTNGNMYGATPGGGTNDGGAVFELSPGSGGTWTKTLLYSFNPKQGDLSYPASNLAADGKGNLYGMFFRRS